MPSTRQRPRVDAAAAQSPSCRRSDRCRAVVAEVRRPLDRRRIASRRARADAPQVSALACAVPWIRTLELDPVTVGNGEARVHGAHIVIDPKRKPEPRLPPHGDPSVSGGARRRSDVARRHVAAGSSDPSRGRRAGARVRRSVSPSETRYFCASSIGCTSSRRRCSRDSRRSTTIASSLWCAIDRQGRGRDNSSASRATSRIPIARARSSRSSSPTLGSAVASRGR